MKKITSLLLVAVMMFALIAVAIPVSAYEWIEEVEALYFDQKPYIDGYITEAEWGEPTTVVTQADAATVSDSDPRYNRFFYNLGTYDASSLSMEYTLWLRWDENYFYVGAKVKDPDGHSLKNGRTSTWNGDAFQCRIDPAGANGGLEDDFFAERMNYASTGYKPWSTSAVCDLQFGYCQIAGGFSEAFDYNNAKGMTSFSNNPLGVCEIGIAPAGYDYNTDTANGITTYEIAIPWSYIEILEPEIGHEYSKCTPKNPNGAIDREYGMSACVLNADGASGARSYNALLSWGSGVCSIQQVPKSEGGGLDTCGGSNSVVLSGTKVSESGATGSYDKYTLGGVPGTEPVAHWDTEKDTSAKEEERFEYKKLTYDNEDDMIILGYNQHAERVQLEDGNWVIQFDKDPGDLDTSPTEHGLHDHNYLSTQGDTDDPADNLYSAKDCSYTMEFDVKVTDVKQFQAGYAAGLYTWFGGSDTVSYAVGYFFDDSKFAVVESSGLANPSASAIQTNSTPFTLNEWHHIVFQYDNETCVMRYYFDPEMDGDHVSANAEPLFSFSYRYFDYAGREECAVILRRMNCQIQLDNIEYYNFVDWKGTGKIDDEIGDPGTGIGGGTIGDVEKEENVDLDFGVEKLEDGSYALQVKNNAKFTEANVTAVTFTVNYDAAKLNFKGVDTISEDAVEINDDGNGTATIKIKDLAVLKDVEIDATLLRVLVVPKDGVTVADDEIKDLVSIKALITTLSKNTGDTVMYVAAAFVIVLAIGTAVVVYRRKRNTVEF